MWQKTVQGMLSSGQGHPNTACKADWREGHPGLAITLEKDSIGNSKDRVAYSKNFLYVVMFPQVSVAGKIDWK